MVNAAEPLMVYIVDDDSSVRSGLTRLMRAAGVRCVAYASPEQFLVEAEGGLLSPGTGRACILLDITMPRVSGTEGQARLNGEVSVFNAENGELLATNPMAPEEQEIRSAVAIAQGALYVRTNTRLFCIGK